MTKVTSFKGRLALKGHVSGSAEVTKTGFNATASYIDVLFANSNSGVCKDHDSNLYDRDLTGSILCIPKTIGSSAAACLYMSIVERGIAPKAMLFAEKMDSIAACGLVMAHYWASGTPIVAVDDLGDEFLNFVEQGKHIDVLDCGTINVHGQAAAYTDLNTILILGDKK